MREAPSERSEQALIPFFSWIVKGKVSEGIPMKISISHIGIAIVVQAGSH